MSNDDMLDPRRIVVCGARSIAMPTLPAGTRARNWMQVERGYTDEQFLCETSRCLHDPQPGCQKGCPVGIPVSRVIELARQKRYAEAVQLVRSANPMFGITALVCPQNEQCQKGCVIGKRSDPVEIGYIMRYLYDWEKRNGGPVVPALLPFNDKRVAIVGSGPSGICAAAFLRQYGCAVDIFESLHVPGGVLAYGIPEFRLPKSIVWDEIDFIRSFGGINFYMNVVIGNGRTMAELRRDYDAVFVATGAGEPITLNIPGEELINCMTANSLLSRVNLGGAYQQGSDTPVYRAKHTVVFGGGNVAMDAARAARRLGSKVTIVYRRTQKEMPARIQELNHAIEEGIKVCELTAPLEFIGDEQCLLTGVRCQRMKLGPPDEKGRASPIPIPGDFFVIKADQAVVAIGSRPNPVLFQELPGILIRNGHLRVDERRKTSEPGVFAGGDAARGGATVILAAGDGKMAAESIVSYFATGRLLWPTKEGFVPVT